MAEHKEPPGAGQHKLIPEVDGLRAIAVLAVLLFHAFPDAVRGGFIGVDIFFVISGFIITRTYFQPLASGTVSLRDFYLRRIRRLAPACITVLTCSLVAAYILLTPRHLLNFGTSLFFQPLYLQNISFWLEGDYFDKAFTKPLLHTWSLAVEEQFYILYAAFILIARRHLKASFAAIFLVSVGSLLLARYMFLISPKTAFYWLPPRIWEFGIGIGCALIPATALQIIPAGLSHLFRAAGVAAILWSVAAFEESSPFPGIQSLLACGATALLLLNSAKSGARSPLSVAPLVFIGAISYPLYLWHWPIIALATTRLDRPLTAVEGLLALALSALLAIGTVRWIEQPIRTRIFLRSNRRLLGVYASTSLAFIAAGGLLVWSDGAADRYPERLAVLLKAEQKISPYRCTYLQRFQMRSAEICRKNSADSADNVLLIGDSHGDQMDEALSQGLEGAGTGFFITKSNCRLHSFFEGKRDDCTPAHFEEIRRDIRQWRIRRVLAISYMDRDFQSLDALTRAVKILTGDGIRVTIMQVVPNGSFFNPGKRAQALLSNTPLPPPYTRAKYLEENKPQLETLRKVQAQNRGVTILDPSPYLCPNDACDFDTNGDPNYIDDDHLSPAGVQRLIPAVERALAVPASDLAP